MHTGEAQQRAGQHLTQRVITPDQARSAQRSGGHDGEGQCDQHLRAVQVVHPSHGTDEATDAHHMRADLPAQGDEGGEEERQKGPGHHGGNGRVQGCALQQVPRHAVVDQREAVGGDAFLPALHLQRSDNARTQ